MQVKLYEDVAPTSVVSPSLRLSGEGERALRNEPSPIPKFDNPKMDMMPALQLFGAGREKRIYAVPPFTRVESLDFDDRPFTVQQWDEPCAVCGSTHSYLMKWCWMTPETACLSAPIPIIAANRARRKANESTVTFGQ